MAMPLLSSWKHVKPKEYSNVEYYVTSGKTATYEIVKRDFGDDDEEIFNWVLVRKQAEANKVKTAVVPVANVYTPSGWKLYPFYARNAKQFNTPKEAYNF